MPMPKKAVLNKTMIMRQILAKITSKGILYGKIPITLIVIMLDLIFASNHSLTLIYFFSI